MKPECDTRHKLLTAATTLMWESSYGSVSVDDICTRAGVRKGSFYYFFSSKCDLTVAAIEDLWKQKQPLYDQVFSPQTPPLERLVRFTNVILESQAEKLKEFGKVCGCPYFTLGAEMSTQDEKIRHKIEEILGRFSRYYETTLCEMMQAGLIEKANPAVKAQEVIAFTCGSLLQAKITNSLQPLRILPNGVALLLGLDPERFDDLSSPPSWVEVDQVLVS